MEMGVQIRGANCVTGFWCALICQVSRGGHWAVLEVGVEFNIFAKKKNEGQRK